MSSPPDGDIGANISRAVAAAENAFQKTLDHGMSIRDYINASNSGDGHGIDSPPISAGGYGSAEDASKDAYSSDCMSDSERNITDLEKELLAANYEMDMLEFTAVGAADEKRPPFEGKGRRARSRRARIKKEILAREHRSANADECHPSSAITLLALSASAHSSTPKSSLMLALEKSRQQGLNSNHHVATAKSRDHCQTTRIDANSSAPFEGRGRRARARRARERKESSHCGAL